MAAFASEKMIGGPYDSTKIVSEINGFPKGDKAIDAAFVASMIDSLITSGIVNHDGHQFEVLPGDGLSVRVLPGVAWARGYMARLNSEATLELTSGHTFKVFIRQNNASGEASLMAYMDDNGTVPTRTHGAYDLLLAVVTVPEGAVSLSDDMITDRRADGVCGYVVSRV